MKLINKIDLNKQYNLDKQIEFYKLNYIIYKIILNTILYIKI